jgi:hypothetical protein
MQSRLDKRVVRVGIEVNGQIKTYEGLNIIASGTKYANENQNDCTVEISNLDKNTLNYILTETSPFNNNRTPKKIFVDAGRESIGVTRVYSGDIVASSPTQPPDITLKLKCLTGNYAKGKLVSTSQSSKALLSQISKNAAQSLGVGLNFSATDKEVTNYAYSGAALKQVDDLNSLGNLDAYIDDDTLFVKDANLPLPGKITVLNAKSGMVGIPEVTERGIKVVFLLDAQTKLGGILRIESKLYTALNGDYVIYKLGFNITSRDRPFYWIAEGLKR